MTCLVAYASQTGFTRAYAEWIADDLECRAVAYGQATDEDVAACDVVVMGGWFHAASLAGGSWLKRMRKAHPNVRFVVFGVGATPVEWTDQVEEGLARALPSPDFDDVPRFYLRGGFDYAKLGLRDKLMMKLFLKAQEKAAQSDERAAAMLEGMREGFDGTDRDAIVPVVACARSLLGEAVRP